MEGSGERDHYTNNDGNGGIASFRFGGTAKRNPALNI